MLKPTVSIYLDKRRPSKKGKYFLRLRITYNRKSRYYDLGCKLGLEQFETIFSSKKKSDADKDIQLKSEASKAKADLAISQLTYFSFDEFEKLYFSNLLATDSIAIGFDQHIEDKIAQKRFGTAESYKTAKSVLEKFLPNGTYQSYTPNRLREFEEYMIQEGKSISTVGVYLRSLRTIFNNAKAEKLINDDLYPFGKRKYSIPSSTNHKRALAGPEIKVILNYDCSENQFLQKAKDVWVFSYLSNGINMMDLCTLKWSDIKSSSLLEFIRTKTKKTKSDQEKIQVVLTPLHWEIIKRWGSNKNEQYLFPFLKSLNSNTEEARSEVKNFTKNINKQLKKIEYYVNLPFHLTTYVARHSYATMMIKAHMPSAQLMKQLGHTSLTTTEKYISSLPTDDLIRYSDKLTDL